MGQLKSISVSREVYPLGLPLINVGFVSVLLAELLENRSSVVFEREKKPRRDETAQYIVVERDSKRKADEDYTISHDQTIAGHASNW